MVSKRKATQRGATPLVKEPKRQPFAFKKIRWPQYFSTAKINWSLIGLPLVIGAIGIGVVKLAEGFVISEIRIQGQLTIIDPDVILKDAQWVIGQPFFSADLETLFTQIQQVPLIQNVDIKKRWPDEITVTLTEEIPVAVFNDTQVITMSGHLTELPKKLDVSGLARINAQSSYIQKALQSFRLVQQGISDSQVRVEQLEVNNIGSTQISLSNGWTVELGSIDTEARIRRLQELLNAIPNQEIAAIDLRYGKGAALTWRRDQEKG